MDAQPSTSHGIAQPNDDDDVAQIAELIRISAVDGLLHSVHLDGQRECRDFEAYLQRLQVRVVREVSRQLRELQGVKVQMKVVAEYEKPPAVQQTGGAMERARRAAKRRKYEEKEKDRNVATITLTTRLTPITSAVNVRPTVQRMLAELRERHINTIQLGSGFVMRSIVSVALNFSKRNRLRVTVTYRYLTFSTANIAL
jgi:hypothetical protein